MTAKLLKILVGVEHKISCFFAKRFEVDMKKAGLCKNYACAMIAGAMQLRVSSRMRQFLDGLSGKDFSGKLAAAFDTQVQSRFSASAAKGIEGKLKGWVSILMRLRK